MKRTSYFLCFVVAIISTFAFGQESAPERKYLSEKNWGGKLRDGDIVFIRSRSRNAGLIAQMTNPEATDDADTVFTHCGIVFKEDNECKVLEGAGRGRILTLAAWKIEEAKDDLHRNGESPHNVYVRRWKASNELKQERLAKLLDTARKLHNTGYDWGFSWTDDYAYCSELIWKAYAAAGLAPCSLPRLRTYIDRLREVSTARAEEALSKLNKDEVKKKYRHGKEVNLDEEAVSPEDIYVSEKLVSVTDNTP
jgi:hypothetical protein